MIKESKQKKIMQIIGQYENGHVVSANDLRKLATLPNGFMDAMNTGLFLDLKNVDSWLGEYMKLILKSSKYKLFHLKKNSTLERELGEDMESVFNFTVFKCLEKVKEQCRLHNDKKQIITYEDLSAYLWRALENNIKSEFKKANMGKRTGETSLDLYKRTVIEKELLKKYSAEEIENFSIEDKKRAEMMIKKEHYMRTGPKVNIVQYEHVNVDSGKPYDPVSKSFMMSEEGINELERFLTVMDNVFFGLIDDEKRMKVEDIVGLREATKGYKELTSFIKSKIGIEKFKALVRLVPDAFELSNDFKKNQKNNELKNLKDKLLIINQFKSTQLNEKWKGLSHVRDLSKITKEDKEQINTKYHYIYNLILISGMRTFLTHAGVIGDNRSEYGEGIEMDLERYIIDDTIARNAGRFMAA